MDMDGVEGCYASKVCGDHVPDSGGTSVQMPDGSGTLVQLPGAGDTGNHAPISAPVFDQ